MIVVDVIGVSSRRWCSNEWSKDRSWPWAARQLADRTQVVVSFKD